MFIGEWQQAAEKVNRITLTEAVCLEVALMIGVAILAPDRNQFPIKSRTDRIAAHTAPTTMTTGTIFLILV
jgi:hypothetical protein